MSRSLPDTENKITDTHGGDLAAVSRQFGRSPDDWIDLSTGINPSPYPVTGISPEDWQRLPQTKNLDRLKRAAAGYYGASDPECVAVAPGTQALIQILPTAFPANLISILGVTYSEHETCWRRAGSDVEIVEDFPPGDRSLIVVNPNNPDGRTVAPARLLDWADAAAEHGSYLFVDEAFADVCPEISLVPSAPRPNVIILRSFGKFFGLAGVRLGFLLGHPSVVASITKQLGPWAVSGPALTLGATALLDIDWHRRTCFSLSSDRGRLEAILSSNGCKIVGATDLYVLVSTAMAPSLWKHLANNGILVRKFVGRSDWLRFGLPASEGEWQTLDRALSKLEALSLTGGGMSEELD